VASPQTQDPAVVPASLKTVALYPAVSRAVYALVVLGVPDLLAQSPASVAGLAARTGVLVRPLRQLLRTAATTGLFRSLPGDHYELTDSGAYLRTGHPSSGRDLILTHLSPTYQSAYNSLLDALRDGRTAFEIEHGQTMFDYYAGHTDEYESFSRMMTAYLGGTPRAVAEVYDVGAGGHMVDCGGGIGTQLVAFLEANERLTGTLFDTPPVIEQASGLNPPTALASRWTTAAGDFFAAVPERGDFYILSHIIHDWADTQAAQILRNCATAAPDHAKFLLVEEIVPDGDDPHPVKMLDVALLSGYGGGERTVAEFDALLAAARLTRTRVLATSTTVSVIEAVKAAP
jgi:hypothetical protein